MGYVSTYRDNNVCCCGKESRINQPTMCIVPMEDSFEWSRTGPMGALMEPKLFPVKSGHMPALIDKPGEYNRQQKSSQNDSPWNIVQSSCLPPAEMLRRINDDRLRTTYRVDFCHEEEYPWAEYDNLMISAGYAAHRESPREIEEKEEPRRPINPPYLGGHEIPGRHRKDAFSFNTGKGKRGSQRDSGTSASSNRSQRLSTVNGRRSSARERLSPGQGDVRTANNNFRNQRNVYNDTTNVNVNHRSQRDRTEYNKTSPTNFSSRKNIIEHSRIITDDVVSRRNGEGKSTVNNNSNDQASTHEDVQTFYETLKDRKDNDFWPGQSVNQYQETKVPETGQYVSNQAKDKDARGSGERILPDSKIALGESRDSTKFSAPLNTSNKDNHKPDQKIHRPHDSNKGKRARQFSIEGERITTTPWTSEYREVFSGTADEILRSKLHYHGRLRALSGNMPIECL